MKLPVLCTLFSQVQLAEKYEGVSRKASEYLDRVVRNLFDLKAALDALHVFLYYTFDTNIHRAEANS